MQLRKPTFVMAFSLILFGCDSQSTKQSQQPAKTPDKVTVVVDISTPDRAIKSYWALQDQLRSEYYEYNITQIPVFLRQQGVIEKVMTGTAYNDIKVKIGVLGSFTREILDVKVESESRAIIISSIRNSTLIPVGAEMSKFQEQSRSEGDRYKYVLEKEQSGWRVAEIWHFVIYSSPPGWSKLTPRDGKPYVDTETFSGK